MNIKQKIRNYVIWILVSLSSILSVIAAEGVVRRKINEFLNPITLSLFGYTARDISLPAMVRGFLAYFALYDIFIGQRSSTKKYWERFRYWAIVFLIFDSIVHIFWHNALISLTINDIENFIIGFQLHYTMIPRFSWQTFGSVAFILWIISKVRGKERNNESGNKGKKGGGSLSSVWEKVKDKFTGDDDKKKKGETSSEKTKKDETENENEDFENLEKMIKRDRAFEHFITNQLPYLLQHGGHHGRRIARSELQRFIDKFNLETDNDIDDFIKKFS